VAVSVSALFAACSGGGGGGAPAPAAPVRSSSAPAFKVGLLSPGPAQDKGWNQLAYDGLMAIKSQLGADVSYVEVADSPSEPPSKRKRVARWGWRLKRYASIA